MSAVRLSNVIQLHLGTEFGDCRISINDIPILCATRIAYVVGPEGMHVDLSMVKGGKDGAEITDGYFDAVERRHIENFEEVRSDMHSLRIGEQTLPVMKGSLIERYNETWVIVDCRLPIGPLYKLELV